MLDVTDIFDEFHRAATDAWAKSTPDPRGGRRAGERRYDAIVDQMEVDCFLTGCADRCRDVADLELTTDEIVARLRVCDLSGQPLPGRGAVYHSHGFDYDIPGAELPANLVVSADLVPHRRDGVRLMIEIDPD